MEPKAFSRIGAGGLASLTSGEGGLPPPADRPVLDVTLPLGGQLASVAEGVPVYPRGLGATFAMTPRNRRSSEAVSTDAGKSIWSGTDGQHSTPIRSFSARGLRSPRVRVADRVVSHSPRRQGRAYYDPAAFAWQFRCTDQLSDGGMKPVSFKRHNLREHGHRPGALPGHGRTADLPWFDPTECSPHLFHSSAGMPTWEGSPRAKAPVGEFEHSKDRAGATVSTKPGVRHYPNHPLATGVVDQLVFNRSLVDDSGRPRCAEDLRLFDMHRGAAGYIIPAENVQGKKQSYGSKHIESQADRVIFGHETFERFDDMYSDCTSFGAAGGQPVGYHGKKTKPPSESGSAQSCTHLVRGKKLPYDPSPTYHSLVKDAAFCHAGERHSPSPHRERGKPKLVWSSEAFQGVMSGRAGMTSQHSGRLAARAANQVYTKSDALSQCSTAYSGHGGGASDDGSNSIRSSRSQPQMKNPYAFAETSNAVYGNQWNSPRQASSRGSRH